MASARSTNRRKEQIQLHCTVPSRMTTIPWTSSETDFCYLVSSSFTACSATLTKPGLGSRRTLSHSFPGIIPQAPLPPQSHDVLRKEASSHRKSMDRGIPTMLRYSSRGIYFRARSTTCESLRGDMMRTSIALAHRRKAPSTNMLGACSPTSPISAKSPTTTKDPSCLLYIA